MSKILKAVKAGQPIDHIPVIDMHTHTGPSSTFYYIPYHMPEQLLQNSKRFGIDYLISFPINVNTDAEYKNRWVQQAWKGCEDQASVLVAMHAAYPQDWLKILKQGDKNGTKGIKILAQYQGVDAKNVDWSEAFQYANDKNWLALAHDWEGPQKLEYWAKNFTGITFIIGHAELQYAKLVEKYENIYQCTCASFVRNYFASIEEMVKCMPIEKIIHGSDAPDLDLGTSIGPIAYSNIPEKAKEKILGYNAVDLFKKLGWGFQQ